jgi:deazaflavin-dependent oxidoreductase (nitroreductase family)
MPVERLGSSSGATPLLGLRERPGRLALAVFRLPLAAYRHGSGWMLGHTFVQVTHVGRRTGAQHAMVAMVLDWDPVIREVVICSAWGDRMDWVRNLRAGPAARVQVGRDDFVPEHRFLTEDEAVAIVAAFRRRHPWRVRFMALVLGWKGLDSEPGIREFVRRRPFVALRPRRPDGRRAEMRR